MWWIGTLLLIAVLFFLLLIIGSAKIPFSAVFDILTGKEVEKEYWIPIVLQTRLPMALAAIACGGTLSISGLMMQTAFANPLAGPSVMGVSSGASLGVAVLMLGSYSGFIGIVDLDTWISLIGALTGGIVVIAILIAFSSMVKNGVMLLVVGIMISYLCSSLISLLNYFSPAEGIRSYFVWGLGSYTGLRLESACWLLVISVLISIGSLYFIKPLNAMLAGDRYTESIGYSIRSTRIGILLTAGLLVAVPTAFCGPIGFIGLVVPHIARITLKTSNHLKLVPASFLYGAAVSLFCAFLGVLPSDKFGILPINVITPLIGVPFILYILLNRKKLLYFR